MKANQILKAMKKHVLPHLPGFRVKGTAILYATPVNMILQGFAIQTSYMSKEAFTVWVFSQPLYVPEDVIVLSMGGRLPWLLRGRDIWWIWNPEDDKREEVVMQDVLYHMQKVGLPFLESTRTPSDIIRWIKKKSSNPEDSHWHEIEAYSRILIGDYRRATRILEKLYPHLLSDKEEYPWMGEMAERVKKMLELLQTSPDQGVRQLYEWRAWTLRALRLEQEIGQGEYCDGLIQ